MKKVFLLALAAIAAGGVDAAVTQQEVHWGYILGDSPHVSWAHGYVAPNSKILYTNGGGGDVIWPFSLTNSPSGWRRTAWLSHAGKALSSQSSLYTESDDLHRELDSQNYIWHTSTDKNAYRGIAARFDPINVTFRFDTAGGPAKTAFTKISTNKFSLGTYNGTREGYGFKCWTNAFGAVVQEGRDGLVLNKFDGQRETNLLTRCFTSMSGSVIHMPGNLPFGVIGNADTNIWLYASWTGNVYKVQMDPNGGAFTSNGATSPRQRSVTFGQAYGALPGVSFTGKTLKGWYTAADGGTLVTGDTIVSTASDHTIYAQWSDKPVVTFYYVNANNETVFEEQYVDYGGTAVPPSRETVNQCPGKVFTGWDRSYANVTESIQVHAQYTVNSYNVVYLPNSDDATGTMVDDHYACYVTWNLRANQFVRSGYTFAGWNTEPDGTGSSYSDGQQVSNLTYDNGGTVTLYAQWSPISYTIAFSGGSGAEGEMAAIPAVYDQAVVLPANAFTKTGCAFLQWAFGTTNFLDGATVSNLTTTAGATVTLTAVWDAPYYIAFDANGGEGTMDVQRFERGEAKALSSNEFSRTGYAFSGWATNAAEAAALNVKYADGQVVADIAEVAETNTLYAVWSTNTYYVAFDANGGEGDAMAPQRFVYDQSQNLTSNTYSMGELWRFGGWSNTVDGVVYADGASVSNLCAEADATNTLLAVWVSNLSDLSKAMHCTNMQWNGVVMSPLTSTNLWTAREGDDLGYNPSGSCAEQTGRGGDVLVASVTTNGTLTFWCRNTSASSADLYLIADEKGDKFYDTGEQQIKPFMTIPAGSGWQQGTVVIDKSEIPEAGPLYLKFAAFSGTVQIDQMTWTPAGGGSPEPTDADRVEPSAVSVSDGAMSISFTGDSAFSYHLLATDSLSPTNWYDYGGTNVGADALQSFEIPIDAGHPQRFFKIETIQRNE